MTAKNIPRKRGDFRDLWLRLGNLSQLWLACMIGWSLAYAGGHFGQSAGAPSELAASDIVDGAAVHASHQALADEP